MLFFKSVEVHTSIDAKKIFAKRRTLRFETIFINWKPFKKIKKAFYVTLKANAVITFGMILEEKYLSCYILLNRQI